VLPDVSDLPVAQKKWVAHTHWWACYWFLTSCGHSFMGVSLRTLLNFGCPHPKLHPPRLLLGYNLDSQLLCPSNLGNFSPTVSRVGISQESRPTANLQRSKTRFGHQIWGGYPSVDQASSPVAESTCHVILVGLWRLLRLRVGRYIIAISWFLWPCRSRLLGCLAAIQHQEWPFPVCF
jgi:hypothetical protein